MESFGSFGMLFSKSAQLILVKNPGVAWMQGFLKGVRIAGGSKGEGQTLV